jgi:hypothetical protein
VAQGVAVLELGTELGTTPLYEFFPAQQVSTDVHGGFSFCAQTVTYPSAIVLEAMDSTGKAYPPYLTTAASGGGNLGAISMGGCAGICGLLGEQQTSPPATITGVIASAPIAVPGTVVPQYAMQALDGSRAEDGSAILWAIALPLFTASPSVTFSTTAGACPGGAPYCTTFTLPVPAQSPLRPTSGGTLQAAVAPTYLVYALPGKSVVCTPSFGFSAFQSDGKSLLTATPGAQLTAQSISLNGCQ